MSYNQNASRSNDRNRDARGDDWKAAAFINISLTSKDGESRRKVHAIPLRSSNPTEKLILDYLGAEPSPEKLSNVVERLVFDYRTAEPSKKTLNEFALED